MTPPTGPSTTTAMAYPHVQPISSRISTTMATNAIHTRPCTNPVMALPASFGCTIQK